MSPPVSPRAPQQSPVLPLSEPQQPQNASPVTSDRAPTRAHGNDGFERLERPVSGRDNAPAPALPPADPALAGEVHGRRSSAHLSREVRTPVIGQTRDRASTSGRTMRGSLGDELDRRAQERFVRDPQLGPMTSDADLSAVRTGLRSARDAMRAGRYDEASRTLHGLREDHGMGFLGNAALGERGMNAAETLERQANVCSAMEGRLHHRVDCPPSEADATAYFATFNNDADRASARGEFERYAQAFYTHTQTALDPSSDIRYSADTPRYVSGGEIYRREADSPADAIRVRTAAPDSWADVTTRRDVAGVAAADGHAAGCRVIDCEGYAYLSERLMGAAGYEVTHVTAAERGRGSADPSDLHSMTSLRDPTSGATFTQSNAGFYDSNYAGYRAAVPSRGLSEAPLFFTSPSMQDSQTLSQDPHR